MLLKFYQNFKRGNLGKIKKFDWGLGGVVGGWGGGELAKVKILVKIKKNWLRGKLKILKGGNLAKGRKK